MLIINNKTFTGETDSREGSEFDVAKLTSTFGRRGYIVHDMQDLSARVRTNFLRLFCLVKIIIPRLIKKLSLPPP